MYKETNKIILFFSERKCQRTINRKKLVGSIAGNLGDHDDDTNIHKQSPRKQSPIGRPNTSFV